MDAQVEQRITEQSGTQLSRSLAGAEGAQWNTNGAHAEDQRARANKAYLTKFQSLPGLGERMGG